MSLLLGDFELDEGRRQLLREGRPVPLEPKAYELLCLLVDRRPRALSRSQIRDAVWGGVFISESTLNQAVNTLRQALGDDARDPRYIRTAHGFGYAYCGEARESTDGRPRVESGGAEAAETSPYPGLAAFTEAEEGVFYGREKEVEALWERIRRQRMLGVIGPSGAGKTSFVRAGIAARRPAGWAALVSTPGPSPMRSLARALAPRMEPDPESVQALVDFDDPDVALQLLSRWRAHHGEALVVVDQLEELFTQCRPEAQAGFASFLGRLADVGRVHVLLSLRDDFLIRCHEHESLDPVFDHLTPLLSLSGEDLRRAVEEPARQRGYAFEDESLARDMVEEAEGARAPLPLLAFAVARLWEERDREGRRLTRAAYEEIGGVGGALARHAEQTLERVGLERTPVVRELFRNLVTAQGTRAARTRGELLSVFEARDAEGEVPAGTRAQAEEVLRVLVDARLLTAYESETDEDGPPEQHVEITHESLLETWPRLVRWRTQEAEGAQLRDQLRQASRLWDEKGRPDDLLWSGAPLLEYRAWRARYPGRLSAVEEDFARAMTARATRARRVRRAVLAGVLVAVSVVAVALAVLWRGSEEARQQSEEARKQAEAASLLSLGRIRLGENPTAALAYAIASLERADNEPARAFATQALWAGPIARVIVDEAKPCQPLWSRDGRWLAVGGTAGFLLIDRDTGSIRRRGDTACKPERFSLDGSRLLVIGGLSGPAHDLFTVPGLDLERTLAWEGFPQRATFGRQGVLTMQPEPEGVAVWEYPNDGGPARRLVSRPRPSYWWVEPTGEGITSFDDGVLRRWRLDALQAPPLVVGRHEGESVWFIESPWSPRVATIDHETREVRVWNLEKGGLEREVRGRVDVGAVMLGGAGRYLATGSGGPLPRGGLQAFDLAAPQGAEPFVLRYDDASYLNAWQFHPEGRWLASGHYPLATLLWNLESRRPVVFRHAGGRLALAFTPQGQLVSSSESGVRLWPLWHELESEPRELRTPARGDGDGLGISTPQVSRDGRVAVVVDRSVNQIVVLPLDGSSPVAHELEGGLRPRNPTLSPDGRRVAVGASAWGRPEAAGIQVLDLETGDVQTLRSLDDSTEPCVTNSPDLGPMQFPLWLSDGTLVSEGGLGLRLWDLEDGTSRQLRGCRDMRDEPPNLAASDTGVVLSLLDPVMSPNRRSTLLAYDMSTGVSREITSHGRRLRSAGIDGGGSVLVTGDAEGLVRVGRLDGSGTPHLLYGHSHPVTSVAVSPDGRWIASAGEDDAIRLWPMPDLSKAPLHTWPGEELLAKLRSFTNLRVVEDPESQTGYTVEAGPFPGWAEVPTW